MNFLLQDIGQSLLAVCLFPIFLIIPGYSIAAALNLAEFHTGRLPTRIALGLVLSIAVTPALTYFLSKAFSLRFACAAFVLGAVTFIAVQLRALRAIPVGGLERRCCAIVLSWLGLAVFLLSDLQIGDRLYPNVNSYDYTWRVAVTSSITRTEIPPANPSFYPGHSVALFYYYLWFLTCSLVDLLGGSWVSARAAVIAGTVWVGIGLMAIVALYVRWLTRTRALEQQAYLAVALLLVSGLDIVPVLMKYVYHLVNGPVILYPTVEWWNEQVTAWPTAVLWVPHHVAALIATLAVWRLFSTLPAVTCPGTRRAMAVICAVGLCSALGLSIWVAFAFAVFWTVWVGVAFVRGWHAEARVGLVVAGVAFLLSLPYLKDLSDANQRTDGMPLMVGVRHFEPLHSWFENHQASRAAIALVDFVALPLNYFVELGFFAVAGVMYWRWRVRQDTASRDDIAMITLVVVAAVVATFLRANIANNDLGWRSAMFAQFVLLLWSADVLSVLLKSQAGVVVARSTHRRATVTLVVSLAIGLLPFAYDAVMMKLYAMVGDLHFPVMRTHGFLDEANLGRRYYDFREAYDWMNRRLPEAAVVQHNPNVYMDLPSGLYGERQVAAAGTYYGPMFGIPDAVYQRVADDVAVLFSDGIADREQASARCRRFGIAVVIVKNTDPIWNNARSWLFREQAEFENRSTRVLSCGGAVAPEAGGRDNYRQVSGKL